MPVSSRLSVAFGGRESAGPQHAGAVSDRAVPDALEGLFYQLVGKLEAMGETDHQTVFVDGTKLESRAGRYTFVWRKSAEKQLAKVKEQVRQQTGLTGLAALASYLEEAVQGIQFVHGKGKRKSPEQKDLGKTAWAAGTVAGI